MILVHANKTSLTISNRFIQRVTILQTEVTIKRLISMLLIAQTLCVGAKSDLCETYKLFIQQYGQRYPSP